MATASDAFTRTEDPLASGWSTVGGLGALKAVGTVAQASVVFTECGSVWTADAFAPDQFSEAVLATVPGAVGIGGGPIVRGKTGVNQAYLFFLDGSTSSRIFKYDGVFTALGASFTVGPTTGHAYRLKVTGQSSAVLEAFDDGVSITSRTDSSSVFTNGLPGIHTFGNSTPSPTWESWNAGQVIAPILQAQGATNANTTGSNSPTIPTHQANDIIIVAAVFWGPNTAGDAEQIPTPTNYTLLGSQVGQPAAANRDGWSALFWRRVSGAGTTVTVTRGASWDTGSDTCFGARAYVIRGCRTTGNPFEDGLNSGPHTAANQAFPVVTVSGSYRLVVQFGNSMDNQTFAMTSSGWTTGTEDNDPAGTDCSFQTARKDSISASTTGDTATVSAPAQGAYAFHGVSFVPPAITLNADAVVVGVSARGASLVKKAALALTAVGVAVRGASLVTKAAFASAAVGVATAAEQVMYSVMASATAVGVAAFDRLASYFRSAGAVAVGVAERGASLIIQAAREAIAVGVSSFDRLASYFRSAEATAVGVAAQTHQLMLNIMADAIAVGVAIASKMLTIMVTAQAIAVGIAALTKTFISGAGAAVAAVYQVVWRYFRGR